VVSTTVKRWINVLEVVSAEPGITPSKLHELGYLEVKRQHLYVLLSEMAHRRLLLRLTNGGYVTSTEGYEVLQAWHLLLGLTGRRGRSPGRRPEAHA
jgi:hypothetical protein